VETESLVLDAATRRAEPDRRIEHAAPPRRPGRFWGITALTAAALSVVLMAEVGLAGPSAAVPEIGAATGRPPWFWLIRPADLTVTLALWTAMVAGAVAARPHDRSRLAQREAANWR
jgi:hypothetical protein